MTNCSKGNSVFLTTVIYKLNVITCVFFLLLNVALNYVVVSAEDIAVASPDASLVTGPIVTNTTTGKPIKTYINEDGHQYATSGTVGLVKGTKTSILITSNGFTSRKDSFFSSAKGWLETDAYPDGRPYLLDAMQGVIVGTLDPNAYPDQIGGASNPSNIWFYREADKASTKIFETVADAYTGLANLEIGEMAIAPVLFSIVAVTSNRTNPSTINTDVEPNVFYSYRLIRKIGDDTFEYSLDDPSNTYTNPADDLVVNDASYANKSDYSTYTINNVLNTYWLDANGKVKYKGKYTLNMETPIVQTATPSTYNYAGKGVYLDNIRVSSSTLEGLLYYPSATGYFYAEEIEDKASLEISTNQITDILTAKEAVLETLQANIVTANRLDGSKASFIDYKTYATRGFEENENTYTIYAVDSNGGVYNLTSTTRLPAGDYTAVYTLQRAAWSNPTDAYQFPLTVAATFKVVDKTQVTVSKIWDDNNNQDGKRPSNITVDLLANDSKTGKKAILSADNNWTYTFEELDLTDTENNQIIYTVTEDTVLEYTSKIEGDVSTGFTITNYHAPETIDITGRKIWNDANNQNGKRPSSITVQLYADGQQIQEISIDANSNWSYTFTNLPKYKEQGKLINYTVDETDVNGYTKVINGYNIINTSQSFTTIKKTNTPTSVEIVCTDCKPLIIDYKVPATATAGGAGYTTIFILSLLSFIKVRKDNV